MRTETVSFPGRDRKTINCLLYRPDGEARVRPAVFLVPGRPLFPTDYEWLIRPLVEKGLAVVGIYQRGYGSPEVDQTTPTVTSVKLSADRLQAHLKIDGLVQGHVHEFDVRSLKDSADIPILHRNAYYTLNEIPKASAE